MGSYRSEDDALIGLARQLTDAYGEARRREDQDFACDSIAEFLSEFRVSAPDEALLAILDLPLTAETYPLVDEAQTVLAGRGSEVVRLLLEAVLGEVYDPDGPAPERAAETLDMMDRRASLRGLTDVLRSHAGDDVKGAAVDALVALGAFAEPELAAALDDPRGGEWAKAALDQIRYEQAHPAGYDAAPDDPGGLDSAPADGVAHETRSLSRQVSDWLDSALDYENEADEDDEERSEDDEVDEDSEEHEAWADEEWTDDETSGEDEEAGVAEAGEPDEAEIHEEGEPDAPAPGAAVSRGDGTPPAGSVAPSGLDQATVEDAYDEFLQRFEEESGGESPAP